MKLPPSPCAILQVCIYNFTYLLYLIASPFFLAASLCSFLSIFVFRHFNGRPQVVLELSICFSLCSYHLLSALLCFLIFSSTPFKVRSAIFRPPYLLQVANFWPHSRKKGRVVHHCNHIQRCILFGCIACWVAAPLAL